MKVLITGGAGFIGSHLASAWMEKGAEVVIIDSFRTGHRRNLDVLDQSKLTFIEGSIEDASLVERACQGVDYIHHLAALVSVPESVEKPHETESINVGGTLNVLEAARKAGVKKVVFSSTSAVYGSVDRPIHREDNEPSPLSPYAVTKLAGEFWMNMYQQLHGLPTVCLRYFNVYGPRQDPKSPYAAAIAIFSEKANTGEAIKVFGDGEQTRDFVFVGDVVRANILAATSEAQLPPVMNVACSGSITINDLARNIITLSESKSTIEYLPERPGDVKHSKGDATLLKSIGWSPEVILADGLELTLRDSKAHAG